MKKNEIDQESCLNCRFNASKCCAGFIHNKLMAKNVRCQLYERYPEIKNALPGQPKIEYKHMTLDEIEYD